MLDHALALARRGLRVFPLHAGRKVPRIKNFPDEATVAEAVIRSWWEKWPDANIGVSTGKGLLVIDVDAKPGRDGRPWAEMAGLDSNFIVRTPSGGLHFYFRTVSEYRGNVDRLTKGVEIKCWHNLVVGPGSVIDGKRYEIIKDEPL
jgi:hypothetical protein